MLCHFATIERSCSRQKCTHTHTHPPTHIYAITVCVCVRQVWDVGFFNLRSIVIWTSLLKFNTFTFLNIDNATNTTTTAEISSHTELSRWIAKILSQRWKGRIFSLKAVCFHFNVTHLSFYLCKSIDIIVLVYLEKLQ